MEKLYNFCLMHDCEVTLRPALGGGLEVIVQRHKYWCNYVFQKNEDIFDVMEDMVASINEKLKETIGTLN